ncbi:MAG: class I SAM-dependent methyltransferase, partial [Hyphomicrobiales bacterium]
MSAGETPLEHILKDLIAQDGPLPVARYMELCLGHPDHGYYRSRDPLGHAGDFITAPEVSQMFGELIGVWCVDAWTAMGAPATLQLIEPGPGRGTLMADILRTLGSIASFQTALDVHLVETSPPLAARQKEALGRFGVPVTWHERFDTVPRAPSVVIANEFFDALPAAQYELRSGRWYERCVGVGDAGALVLGLAPEPVEASALNLPAAPMEEGAIWELSPARTSVAQEIGALIAGSGGA